MSEFREHESLLNDVLAEGSGAGGFGDQLLSLTLQGARRRRRSRALRRAAAVTGAALLPLALWRWASFRELPAVAASGIAIVQTRPMTAACLVQTAPRSSIEVVSSTPSHIPVVSSDDPPPVPEVTDEDLLTLAGAQAMVLVHYGPGDAELLPGGSGPDPVN